MIADQRLAQVFVELADTLVDEFDALDFLHTLAERIVELLEADDAGVIVGDPRSHLRVVASTSDRAEVLELFEIQNDEGPCFDCFSTGAPVVNVALSEAYTRWPRFSAAAARMGYRYVHALPLRLRDSVVGAVCIFCEDTAQLSEENITRGQALADIATIGLLQERAVRESGVLVEQLKTALSSRVVIEQAKGALLASAGIPVDRAFELMRAYSRSHNLPVKMVARRVIERQLTADDLQAS